MKRETHPDAYDWLIICGHTPEEINDMLDSLVIGIYDAHADLRAAGKLPASAIQEPEITKHHTNEVKKYPVEITETLSRIIRMEASTSDEAVEKVKTLYRKGMVVLDSGDYVDTDFKVLGNSEVAGSFKAELGNSEAESLKTDLAHTGRSDNG
ncbi:MAG: DpnD/PcfM family protein [Defluviitaleaceae bacterium]|nr:DpnD/PcfM family protein [Defluviitaleaceae bacterium]